MASRLYNKGAKAIASSTGFQWDDAALTIKIMLIKNTYTFDSDQEFVDDAAGSNDIADHELTVTGTSRKTLTGRTITVNADPTNTIVFDATDPSAWTLSSGETIAGLVVYREVTNDQDSPVIVFLDVTDTATTGGNFSITFDATNGVFRLKTNP